MPNQIHNYNIINIIFILIYYSKKKHITTKTIIFINTKSDELLITLNVLQSHY